MLHIINRRVSAPFGKIDIFGNSEMADYSDFINYTKNINIAIGILCGLSLELRILNPIMGGHN